MDGGGTKTKSWQNYVLDDTQGKKAPSRFHNGSASGTLSFVQWRQDLVTLTFGFITEGREIVSFTLIGPHSCVSGAQWGTAALLDLKHYS